MTRRPKLARIVVIGAVCLAAGLLFPAAARAHCETLDGPVVKDARLALDRGDVTPVLRWVRPADEKEIRQAFEKTLVVRAKGPEARDLADTYFFETLVRVHRAGEGAPYTGLKPAGTDLGPAVTEADKALETGSVDKLVGLVTRDIAEGIRRRFSEVTERRRTASENPDAGRRYVAGYVKFVHYVERLHQDAIGPAGHHSEETAAHEAEGKAKTEPAHEQ